MNTVLLVTDFSAAARNAAKYVLDWVQDIQLQCRVVLLNTYLIPFAPPDQLIRLNDELRGTSLKNLKEEFIVFKNLLAGNSDVQVETISHMGTLESVIGYLTEKSGIVCVAIGNDGTLNLNSLKKIRCPILVIPADAHYMRGDFSSKISIPKTVSEAGR